MADENKNAAAAAVAAHKKRLGLLEPAEELEPQTYQQMIREEPKQTYQQMVRPGERQDTATRHAKVHMDAGDMPDVRASQEERLERLREQRRSYSSGPPIPKGNQPDRDAALARINEEIDELENWLGPATTERVNRTTANWQGAVGTKTGGMAPTKD
jgi:hypothetical protein